MADIVIDYELLYQLGRDTDALKLRVSDARTTNHNYSPDEVGANASFWIGFYYKQWSGAFQHAWDLLEALSSTYTGVAQQWFDQDAGYAATANEQAAGFTHSMWQMEQSAYDNWKKLSETFVTVHGYDENGNPYEMQVPLADPNAPPDKPGAEPTGYDYTAPDGSTHHTTTTYDADGNLTSNDTVVKNSDGQLSYHEHSTFGDNGSYSTSVTHADGTTTTQTVTANEDGTGTRTDVTVGTDGSTSTTTYTGTGLDTANPVWDENDPAGDDDGGGDGGQPDGRDGDGIGGGHPQIN